MKTTIFKAKSTNALGYSKMYNYSFKDLDHDIIALGMLIYLLSLPDDWVIYKSELYERLKQGRTVIDKAFKTLIDKGYIVGVRKIKPNGQIDGYEWSVHAIPYGDLNRMIENVHPVVDSPNVDLPYVGKTTTGETTSTKETFNTKETITNNNIPSIELNSTGNNLSLKDKSNKPKIVPAAPAHNYSTAVVELTKILVTHFPERNKPTTKAAQLKWLDVVDKLIRLDGYTPEDIKQTVEWARNDSFWSSNFLSILKLRKSNDGVKYMDTLFTRMEAETKKKKEVEPVFKKDVIPTKDWKLK